MSTSPGRGATIEAIGAELSSGVLRVIALTSVSPPTVSTDQSIVITDEATLTADLVGVLTDSDAARIPFGLCYRAQSGEAIRHLNMMTRVLEQLGADVCLLEPQTRVADHLASAGIDDPHAPAALAAAIGAARRAGHAHASHGVAGSHRPADDVPVRANVDQQSYARAMQSADKATRLNNILNRRIADLEIELRASRSDLGPDARELDAARTEAATSQARLVGLERELAQVRDELAGLASAPSAEDVSAGLTKTWDAERKTLSDASDAAETKLRATETELRATETELRSTQEELEAERKQLADAQQTAKAASAKVVAVESQLEAEAKRAAKAELATERAAAATPEPVTAEPTIAEPTIGEPAGADTSTADTSSADTSSAEEIAELEALIDDLSRRGENDRDELRTLTSERDALTDRVAQLQAEIDDEVSSVKNELDSIRSGAATDAERRTEVETEKAALTETNATLAKTNRDLEAANAKLAAESTAHSNKVAELDHQIAGFDSQIAGLNSQIARLNSQIDGHNGQLAGLKTQITGHDNDATGLREEIKNLTGQVSERTKKIEALDAELKSERDRRERLGTKSDEASARQDQLTSDLANVRAELVKRDNELTASRNQLTTIKSQLRDAQSAADEQLHTAAKKHESTQAELAAKQAEQLAAKQAELATANATTAELRNKIGTLEADIRARDDVAKALSKDVNEQTGRIEQLDATRTELEGLIDQLSKDLESAKASSLNSERSLTTLRAQHETATAQLSQRTRDLESVTALRAQLQVDFDAYAAEREQLATSRAQQAEYLEELEALIDQLETDGAAARNARADDQVRIEELEREVPKAVAEAVAQERKQADRDVTEVKAQLIQSEKNLSAQERRVIEAGDEIAKLHAHIDSLTTQTDERVAEAFESASRLGNRAAVDAEGKATLISQLETKLATATERARRAETEARRLETEVATLNDVLKRS